MSKKLWNFSTTLRNPNRIIDFLGVAKQIEGKIWNHNLQEIYQILLIQNRVYTPDSKNLNRNQIEIIKNPLHVITYEEASQIFRDKKYESPSMRGRNSFSPLKKLGLAYAKTNESLYITELGNKLISGEYNLSECMFQVLLKYQYPNPLSGDFSSNDDYNIKPFICILKLISIVNKMCAQKGLTVKGISRIEFGIFGISLFTYNNIEKVGKLLLEFRERYEEISKHEERENYKRNFIAKYLEDYSNGSANNVKEYIDNNLRYLRLTNYVVLRGNGYYLDLEQRRAHEIDLLLKNDEGKAIPFYNEREYVGYLSDTKAYALPWQNVKDLYFIANNTLEEIRNLEEKLGVAYKEYEIIKSVDELNRQNEFLKQYRKELQTQLIKIEYGELDKIDEVVDKLENIRNLGEKPSIALERWANVALNIINDAISIKANAPVSDDNIPTFTAPAGVPDIEFSYETFKGICEVTMLTSRDQWVNEGQPVQRHLREYEKSNPQYQNYCLFVAPAIHRDTLNTFWISNKYEYEGERQRIIPITINDLIFILGVVKRYKQSGNSMSHTKLKELYDNIVQIEEISDSNMWKSHINESIKLWSNSGE